MYSRMKVSGQLADGIVIKFNVSIEKVFPGANVVTVLFPSFSEVLRAEVWWYLYQLCDGVHYRGC